MPDETKVNVGTSKNFANFRAKSKWVRIALVLICVSLIAWIVFVNKDALTKFLPTEMTANAKSRSQNSAGVSGLSAKAGAASTSQSGESIFENDVRALLASQSISQIDYARMRIWLNCLSFLHGPYGVKLIDEEFSTDTITKNAPNAINVGSADRTLRIAAYKRSLEKCKKLYGNRPISQAEADAIVLSPTGKEWRTLSKAARNLQLNDPKSVEVLEKVLSQPMFGAIGALLMFDLDYSVLESAYGEQAPYGSLQDIVSTILLCRLGENCDSSSILSEQLCWQNAICVPNVSVEEAILSNLRRRGIDTDALNNYINATYARIVARDISLFVRKK